MHLQGIMKAAFMFVALFSQQQGVQSSTKTSGLSCPDGWFLGGTSCFQAVCPVSPIVNRNFGKVGCENLIDGGALACIKSKEEQSAGMKAMLQHYMLDTTKGHFWIGLHDADSERGGTSDETLNWQCETGEGNGDYSFFVSGQPDDGTDENCVFVIGSDAGFQWRDGKCTRTEMDGFLCSVAAT